jgi:putative ABC transport system permease protein
MLVTAGLDPILVTAVGVRVSLRDVVEMALHSLRVNHVRGALTTAGVVVGVAGIILVTGIGKGMITSFDDDFGQLSTQIEIDQAKVSQPGVDVPPRDLTDSDVAALANKTLVPDVATVTPVVTGVDVIRSGTGYSSAAIEGSTIDFLRVDNRTLAAGSSFTATQARDSAPVVVLGPGPAARLFGADPRAAIGQRVRIARTSFLVLGVLRANGADDSMVLMPLGAARRYVVGDADNVGKILIDTPSTTAVAPAVREITDLLSARHHIADPLKRDFTVNSFTELLAQDNQRLLYLGIFVVGAAAISLLVGAVGIANVMLVSVTERTKEIGIRRAVGARRREIVTQFLFESAVLAGMGGVCGVIVGIGVTVFAGVVIPRTLPDYGTPEVSLTATILAFTISVLVGVAAGIYPARRAVRIPPIDALRYE